MQEQGFRLDLIHAVLAIENAPLEQLNMIQYLQEKFEDTLFKKSVTAALRCSNILKTKKVLENWNVDETLFQHSEEQQLWKILQKLPNNPNNLEEFLKALFELEPFISQFFEKVMVMDHDRFYTKKSFSTLSNRA